MTKVAKRGRPTLYGKRLKDNGLSEDLDVWLHAEAKRRSIKYSELKRIALEEFRHKTQSPKGTVK